MRASRKFRGPDWTIDYRCGQNKNVAMRDVDANIKMRIESLFQKPYRS